MENKKYLDKVLDHLVRGTKIDYEKELLLLPFLYLPSLSSIFHLSYNLSIFFSSFSDYCRKQFGLTEDEIGYVWKEYKSIIEDKIKNNGK